MPKETIKYEIMAQFKRLKPLLSKQSPSILREFAIEISLFCRRMADLGLASDNYSCVIMQDVYDRLDQDTALRYHSRIELKRELGILVTEDLDSLAAFIRSEATTLELSASSTIPGPPRKSAFPGKSVNALYNPENITGTKHYSQFNKSKCKLGCETEHRLIDCTIYVNMSLEEKRRFIRTTLHCFISFVLARIMLLGTVQRERTIGNEGNAKILTIIGLYVLRYHFNNRLLQFNHNQSHNH